MKYNININQKKAVEWGLTSSEAIVFSWIYELASWADKIEYKNKTYYYGSKNKACEELPIVSNKRDTIYRLFKSLQGKGVVELITLGKSDYLALTNKGKEWYDINISDLNPNVGNKHKETELNPIYNNTIKEKDNIKEDTIVSKKDENNSDIKSNIDELYKMYPSKCPKRNISLGKCFKDKERLKKLLKTHSYEMLKFTIEREISEKYNKSYMANFSTFLNNLPDYGFDEKLKKQVDDKSEKINESIEIDGVTYK